MLFFDRRTKIILIPKSLVDFLSSDFIVSTDQGNISIRECAADLYDDIATGKFTYMGQPQLIAYIKNKYALKAKSELNVISLELQEESSDKSDVKSSKGVIHGNQLGELAAVGSSFSDDVLLQVSADAFLKDYLSVASDISMFLDIDVYTALRVFKSSTVPDVIREQVQKLFAFHLNGQDITKVLYGDNLDNFKSCLTDLISNVALDSASFAYI